jgi:hypothetical protein
MDLMSSVYVSTEKEVKHFANSFSNLYQHFKSHFAGVCFVENNDDEKKSIFEAYFFLILILFD